MGKFANYQEQRQAFLSLLNTDCEKRILFFRGPIGTGKTSLLIACQNDVCEPIYHLPVQLKNTAVSISEIFWRSGNLLGWDRLPNFTSQLSDFSGININIDHNKIRGSDNQIRVVLHSSKLEDRDYRQAVLTSAWFEDISEIDDLILIVMDTFEKANTEVKEWISGPFLSRVAHTEKIRTAIAGQEIPTPENIEWGPNCQVYDLFGVPEAKYWLPVINTMKRRIPVEHELDWMSGICHALKGNPDAIMKIIQGLPEI
jgi:hypothetical protein